MTVGFVTAGAVATVLAAQEEANAAWFAGASTVLGSLERTLRIRERWMEHLSRYMQIKNLKMKYETGLVVLDEATDMLARCNLDYAAKVPIEQRDFSNPEAS